MKHYVVIHGNDDKKGQAGMSYSVRDEATVKKKALKTDELVLLEQIFSSIHLYSFLQ